MSTLARPPDSEVGGPTASTQSGTMTGNDVVDGHVPDPVLTSAVTV